MPKVNVNAFGVVNLKFAAYEYGAGLRETWVRFLSLVPSALCLEPFAYASGFARLDRPAPRRRIALASKSDFLRNCQL